MIQVVTRGQLIPDLWNGVTFSDTEYNFSLSLYHLRDWAQISLVSRLASGQLRENWMIWQAHVFTEDQDLAQCSLIRISFIPGPHLGPIFGGMWPILAHHSSQLRCSWGLGSIWWTVIHLSKYSIFPPMMRLHYFRHRWTDRVVTSLSGLIWKIILKLRVIVTFPGRGRRPVIQIVSLMIGRMTAPGVSLTLVLATLFASRYPEIKTYNVIWLKYKMLVWTLSYQQVDEVNGNEETFRFHVSTLMILIAHLNDWLILLTVMVVEISSLLLSGWWRRVTARQNAGTERDSQPCVNTSVPSQAIRWILSQSWSSSAKEVQKFFN